MNKAELSEAVAEKTGLTLQNAERAVDAVLDSLTEALASGSKVQIPGFGSFEVRERSAREGKNPSTGETIQIPAAKIAVFKPGKNLKDTVNQ